MDILDLEERSGDVFTVFGQGFGIGAQILVSELVGYLGVFVSVRVVSLNLAGT